MSKRHTLRALVSERLAAAAEDIFVLFERWTAEYEEELCRYKEENQRKQQLLDKVLSPKIILVRGNYQIPTTSPRPGLIQETSESPGVKEELEEQSFVKQEEDQLPVPVPESSFVCVKTEESSLLQQRQTEHREETQGEDISSEPHFHLETETEPTEHSSDADTDERWEPFNPPASQMETEADGDHDNQVQSRDRSTELSSQNKTAPETTVHNENTSGAKRKKFHCLVCDKSFIRKTNLTDHLRVHTGEKPYSCSFCEKTFSQNQHRNRHQRRHTGERPFWCQLCKKTFIQKCHLVQHLRTHTGEKPYGCTVCKKKFVSQISLDVHTRRHTGEQPYQCTVCKKSFLVKAELTVHSRTHTGRNHTAAQSVGNPLLFYFN